jgi:hypothetical protein
MILNVIEMETVTTYELWDDLTLVGMWTVYN